MAFIQAILGQKPFIRDYLLLGGKLRIRFRTLTVREIDTIYKQVLLEQERGLVTTMEDYVERLSRYRLYLQTIQVVAAPSFQHDLPDGYDQETNPHAEAFYKFEAPADPRETALPQIEDFMVTDVFRTEMIQRIAHNQMLRFNRLVAKLEALVDNSDFWQPTGEQS
jgi:hypothetical protein